VCHAGLTLEGGEALATGARLGQRDLFLGPALEALADERVQRGQAVQQRRGILGVQRVLGQARVDEGAQAVFGGAVQLVVLLGDLDDGGEVEPAEALELLGLLGDAVELLQHLLQQLLAVFLAELRLRGRIVAVLRKQALALVPRLIAFLTLRMVFGLDAYGQWLQLLLAGRGAVAQLQRDFLDEVVHLLHLHVAQLCDEGLEVLVGPRVVILVVLDQLLELVVVDVLVFPRRIHASAQGGAELHRCA
jgi:hypothetical protein